MSEVGADGSLSNHLGFGVSRKDLRRRMDVSYALAGRAAADRSPQHAPQPTDGETVTLTPLGELVTEIRYGTSVRATSAGPGTPMLRMGNIRDGEIDSRAIKMVELPGPELDRLRLRPGDVLVNRTNTRELVGKAAVFNLDGNWVYASYLIRMRFNRSWVDPEFVAAWLATSDARRQINQLSRRSAGQTNINSQELRALRIPLPSPEKQHHLVNRLQRSRTKRATLLGQASELQQGIEDILLTALRLRPVQISSTPLEDGFVVSGKLLGLSRRLDAAFFHPDRVHAVESLQAGPHPVRRLSDAADFVKVLGESESGTFLGLAAVESNTGRLVQVDEDGVDGGPVKGNRFSAGDVLFGRLRPNLNKVWVADRAGICSPEFRVLRAKADVIPSYLALVLRARHTLLQTIHAVSGNTHPRIRDDDLAEVLLSIPPFEVQRSIVGRVSETVSELNSLSVRAEGEWARARADFEDSLSAIPRLA